MATNASRSFALPLLLFLLVATVYGKESYYEVLGVPKDADAKAIKGAYRKMALKWHPDKNPDDRQNAELKFRDVAEAYEVLSDEKRRKTYDMGGDPSQPGGGDGFGDFGGFGGFGGFKDPNDLFKDMFGKSDPFADFSKFFEDVTFEEQDSSTGEQKDTRAALEQALYDFYRAVGRADRADLSKVREVLSMPKWQGKEMKMFRNLAKKYADPKYAEDVETLHAAFEAFESSRPRSGGGGGFGGGFGDMGGFGGGFGDMGGFKMDMGGFGGGGGGSGFSSMSFSSTTFSSGGGGKTVKSETKIQGGKRVTKTVESDASGTRATLEEEEGGKIKRQRGTKKAEQLDGGGSGSGGDEM